MNEPFSHHVSAIQISREEYPLFYNGMPADSRLPTTYGEWQAAVLAARNAHRTAGLNTRPIEITWVSFCHYARRLGLKPDYPLLSMYAAGLGLAQYLERRGA